MFCEYNNNTLADLIKTNPEIEGVIQTIISDNKRTTSMFVHEIRNPLTLMKSTIQYIETKHPETKDFKYWNQLQDLVDDLEQMMADASLLNSYYSLKKAPTDLIALLSNMKDSFMPQASNKQIDLKLLLKEGCEPYFSTYNCDGPKLKQVLSNLIKNAFEATSPGDFINITLSYLPDNNHLSSMLSIMVSNNGSCIPEDEVDTIFTPFVTYKKGGTGIGLAIVKKIIDLHFGSIQVTSNNELTSFHILLPIIY